MARHPPDPALIDLVREAVEAGAPYREIAAQAGVAPATIQRWCKDYKIIPRTPVPPAMAARAAARAEALPATDDQPADEGDSLAIMRAMQRDLRRQAREAGDAGNYTASQRMLRDAANLSPVIARLEKLAQEGGDTLHISRADIEAAHASLQAKVVTLLDRPLLCAHCGRALSANMGKGEA